MVNSFSDGFPETESTFFIASITQLISSIFEAVREQLGEHGKFHGRGFQMRSQWEHHAATASVNFSAKTSGVDTVVSHTPRSITQNYREHNIPADSSHQI